MKVQSADRAGSVREVVLFGRTVSYVEWDGPGIPIVLVHGMGSSGTTWGSVPAELGAAHRVIVLDLPGHGRSDAGPGDYSLGALASTVRDLLDWLGIEQVHLVGHSLGGGIAMQFAYQFPTRVASMTLESSGGLGPDAGVGLRAASLPGAELVLRMLASRRVQDWAMWTGTRLSALGVRSASAAERGLDRLAVLGARDRRDAFLATLRAVVGPQGQRVSALERLSLVDGRRVLIVWGDRDAVIPVEHGHTAHAALPGSRLVVFGEAGHEPHTSDGPRFAEVVAAHVGHWDAVAVDSADPRTGSSSAVSSPAMMGA